MRSLTADRFLSGRGLAPRLGVGILALALAGCDTESLVDLRDPDLVTGEVARDTANINELRNGVRYEFARAVGGVANTNETPGIVGVSGLFTDELWYVSTFDSMQRIDSRNILDVTNTDLTRTFQRIHRARNISEQALGQYAATGRANTADAAMLANYAGFAYLFFAENFCSGVPISSTSLSGEVVFGQPQTTLALLDSATKRFQTAIASATAAGSAEQLNTARVGLGRTLVAQGKLAEAAAAVAQVPTSFVSFVPYSEASSGQNNGVWQNVNSERRSSAASGEGVNGIVFFRRGPTNNTLDPRVPVDSVGVGLSTTRPFYRQNKYPTRGSPIPLASGVEARLIEAENALNKGASTAYLSTLNSLRTAAGVSGTLTDPGNATARVRQFFTERAFHLYLTGHRLGDLRRMVRYYGFQQDQVFPTGQTIFSGSYGTDVNLPIPQQEQNNPEAPNGQCLDRNA